MSTLAEQVVEQLKTDMDNVYDAGYQKGKSEGGDSYYDTFWDSVCDEMDTNTFRCFSGGAWNDTTFRPPKDIVLTSDSRQVFYSSHVKNFKGCIDDRGLKIDFTKVNYVDGFFTESSAEHIGELDLTTIVNKVGISDFCQRCRNLVTIDKIKFGNNAEFKNQPFHNCAKLESVTFEGEFSLSIAFNTSPRLSDASVQNIIDCLVDLTGQATQTLTLHADVKAKLTEEQIATITSKNWTLA